MTNLVNDPLEVFKFCPKCGEGLKPQDHHGQVMPTCQNGACGFIYWQNAKPCVAAILQNDEGKILMTVRGKEPEKGLLDLPGGFVDLGELPEEAAVREAREEIGVDIRITGEVGFCTDSYYYQGVNEAILTVGYSAEITAGEVRIADPIEIVDIQWVSPENVEMEKLAFRSNEFFLHNV